MMPTQKYLCDYMTILMIFMPCRMENVKHDDNCVMQTGTKPIDGEW